MKNIKVLDCTCRDGGYYNSWNFDIKEINKYLLSCSRANIDIVEIGFVFPKNKSYGLFAHSQKKLFKKLQIPKNLEICVMINAKDFYGAGIDQIKKLFQNSKKNFFKSVRIAINFNEYYLGKPIVKALKKLGYRVGFNLMQSHNKNKNDIEDVAKNINKWKNIDYLYFADSVGCMNPEYVSFFCKTIKKHWKKNIGIHAHNNKSFALINTLEAIKAGAKMVDCTIMGMGRGAGNTCTEHLLEELKKINNKYKPEKLINTFTYFQKLKNKYNWGPNYFYHFSASKNIHPTYTQKLLTSEKYNQNDISEILENLAKQKSQVFKQDYLDNEIYKVKEKEGNFNASNFFSKKNVLIIGSGETGKIKRKKIETFIKKNKPLVISLNINPYIPNKYIDYYISCFDFRVFFELSELLKRKKYIISPINKFQKKININLKKEKILNYDLVIKKNSFKSFSNYCEIDRPLALTYALAFCQIANPKKINFAFIEGYKNNKTENNYLKKIIKKYEKNNRKKITFLTKGLLN